MKERIDAKKMQHGDACRAPDGVARCPDSHDRHGEKCLIPPQRYARLNYLHGNDVATKQHPTINKVLKWDDFFLFYDRKK